MWAAHGETAIGLSSHQAQPLKAAGLNPVPVANIKHCFLYVRLKWFIQCVMFTMTGA